MPPVSVEVQWAVHGKRLDRRGYRLLACSTGDLSARHFEEAIGRFSPGTPGVLPQVTVSFVHASSKQDDTQGTDYLALAVHDYADQMEGDDGQLKYDDDGRRIVVTRYFCVKYPLLASKAVTYQAMFQALNREALPMIGGPPIKVDIAVDTPLRPAVDDLAMRAAALLLTTRPVCLLGADDTTMAERLAFIDTVMSLLPYGLRPRMTAATWTRPTNRDHRFRLFFSDAARSVDQPDCILYWGRPEETVIDSDDDWAFEYLTWLRDKVGEPAAKLAGLTGPIGFGRDQVLQVLDTIGVVGTDPRLNYSETRQDFLHPREYMPRTVTPQGQSHGEIILRNCARHLAAGDQIKIKSDIGVLENIVNDPLNHDFRPRFQQVLRETGLLERIGQLGANAGRLYECVLRVAFRVPFDYEAYCQVENCLADPSGSPPHPGLLLAIDHCGVSDRGVRAMLYWHLRKVDAALLSAWHRSGEASPADLIHMLAIQWERPWHARDICDLLLDWLSRMSIPVPNEITETLGIHGFLAYPLQSNRVGDEQYQVSALYQFLTYTYRAGLEPKTIHQILTGGSHPPTPPLLAAILLCAQPHDAEVATHAYTLGLMRRTFASDKAMSEHILDRLPIVPDAAG
jgi:hypothetical protein